jgi:hypothetical protein
VPPISRAPTDELAHGGPEREGVPRRVRQVLIALTAVAAVGLAVADVGLSGLLGGDRPGGSTSHARDDGDNDLQGVDWPARGDLANDEDFVDAALDRIRTERSRVSRVYFAGHLPDGTVLVLAGSDVRRGIVATAVHALHLPAGTAPAHGTLSEGQPLLDPAQVLGWLSRGASGRVVGVVLTRPGPVRFEVSARVDFRPEDSWVSRSWWPVSAEDGMALLDLGTDVDPMVGLRAEGAGTFSVPILSRVEPRVRVDDVVVRGVDAPGYVGPRPDALRRALLRQLGTVVDFRTAGLNVIWSGALWHGRALALVVARDAHGQRFQALVGEQFGRDFVAGVRALPPDQPETLPWLLEPFSPNEATLLICPTGAGTLVYQGEGKTPRVLPVRGDGLAAIADPAPSPPSARGAQLELRDPDGQTILRTTIPLYGFDDPLALG